MIAGTPIGTRVGLPPAVRADVHASVSGCGPASGHVSGGARAAARARACRPARRPARELVGASPRSYACLLRRIGAEVLTCDGTSVHVHDGVCVQARDCSDAYTRT